MCATAACIITRRAGTARQARSYWSSGVTTRPERSRSTHCVGASFRTGAKIRQGAQADQRQTVATLPTFRDAYRMRRCIVPVDGFFEWKAIKGQRAKQPDAIAMKDGSPFGIAAPWENWKDPASGEWIRIVRRYHNRRERISG